MVSLEYKRDGGYRWFFKRHRTKDFWLDCRFYFFGFDIAIYNKFSSNGLGSYEGYKKVLNNDSNR